MLETIHTMERIMVEYGRKPILREATFILKNEGNPTRPDFRVWNSIRPFYVYVHDDLMDHREYNIVDAGNHFIWQGVYLDIIPQIVGIRTPHASEIRMQLPNEPVEENNDDENENEEEEEEEEEDRNWVDEEEARTPPPMMIEEDPNHALNPLNMDFDRDLEIPNYGRMETYPDPTIWRDIHVVDEHPRVTNELVNNPMEVEKEDEAILREARVTMDQIWEESRRELGIEENSGNG